MIVIVAVAFLLAAYVQFRTWYERQMLIVQLLARIEANQIVKAQAHVMAADARRREDPPEVVRHYENHAGLLKREEQELRQQLDRLQD
jgi:hypothetical protein